ncbi:MAG: hypothetical protein ACR2RV_04565 [Verrucomicrobiales bacterium]
MNKPIALISILTCSLPFVSCSDTPNSDRNTVFYPADESPRTGMTQRQQRFGYRGSSNQPNTNPSSNNPQNTNSGSSGQPPSDPDGIVMPRDPATGPGLETDPAGAVEETGTGTGADGGTTPAPSAEAPYAEAVPGKYGLVYSPFVADKKKALVNVTDENNVPLPPGTEVQCPLTGKIFRVP